MISRHPKFALTLYLVGMVVLHAVVAWNSRDLVRKGYQDFTIFYSAAKIVRQGMGAHLYEEPTQFRVQQEFASGVSIRQGALPYNHPPFEAALYFPLTFLPYFAAYVAWDFINLVILFALPFLLRPHVPILRDLSPAFCLLASVGFFPVFIALLQGQDIIVELLIFTLAFIALKTKADFRAGALLGLGLFRFHLIAPLVLVLLLQNRKKALGGLVTVACALGLLSIAMVGWRETLAYPNYVWSVEQAMGRGAIVPADMPNLRGLADTLLAPLAPNSVVTIIVAAVSIALSLLMSAKWKLSGDAARFDLGFSLCLVITILVSYHAFAYDLSLLLLPVLIVANYLRGVFRISKWDKFALLTPVCILFFSPLLMVIWWQYGHLNLLAPVLLLWAWGITKAISVRASSNSEVVTP
jgi:glycosyl transferase family 87